MEASYTVLLCVLILSCTSLSNSVKIPAVIAFGDSLADTGNNNEIITPSKSNFPPYGKDLGTPTGRFSNGKVIPDLLAEKLGIKDLVPPYSDKNLNSCEIKTGVSFASGGTGYDPLTSTITMSIPLFKQLELYKEYIEKLKGTVGDEEAYYILNEGIHLLSAGNNDLITYYTGIREVQNDIDTYADQLVIFASGYIKEMYRLGARKIVVLSPITAGCVPLARTILGGLTRKCVETINEGAKKINLKLFSETISLTNMLPESKIVFVDLYWILVDAIENPHKYGFEVVDKGCCGTGTLEAGPLCNSLVGTCVNDCKYLFWDATHLTERAYRIVVDMIIQDYCNSLFF